MDAEGRNSPRLDSSHSFGACILNGLNVARPFALALAAMLLCAAASAQLKPPTTTGPGVAPPRSAPLPDVPAPAPTAAPAVAASPSAGGDAAEKEAAGKLAAQGWLLLLDRRDWGRAWEASAGMFRSTVPLGNWMDAFPKVRAPLGNLVE